MVVGRNCLVQSQAPKSNLEGWSNSAMVWSRPLCFYWDRKNIFGPWRFCVARKESIFAQCSGHWRFCSDRRILEYLAIYKNENLPTLFCFDKVGRWQIWPITKQPVKNCQRQFKIFQKSKISQIWSTLARLSSVSDKAISVEWGCRVLRLWANCADYKFMTSSAFVVVCAVPVFAFLRQKTYFVEIAFGTNWWDLKFRR